MSIFTSTPKFNTVPTVNFRQLDFLAHYLKDIDGFIAGGCFKHILSGETPKDLDVYFSNEAKFKAAVRHFTHNSEYTFSYKNSKVTAFNNVTSGVRVELINTLYGSPKEVLSNFDFTITKMAFYTVKTNVGSENMLTYHKDFFEHFAMKRLVIDDKLPFPISTFERTYKYRDYGYALCRESKLKLLREITNINEVSAEALSDSFYGGWD